MNVLWLAGFAAGGAFVFACLAVTRAVEPATLVPRVALPPRVSTLASFDRMRERAVTLTDVRLAVAGFFKKIVLKYVDDVARWVMSSLCDPGFAEWWEESWSSERKRMYHGRRRYEEVSRRTEWRQRWAEYDTQGWPTLSTSGDAWVLVPTLTPMSEKALVICSGMTFNVDPVKSVEHVARNLSENPRLLHAV